MACIESGSAHCRSSTTSMLGGPPTPRASGGRALAATPRGRLPDRRPTLRQLGSSSKQHRHPRPDRSTPRAVRLRSANTSPTPRRPHRPSRAGPPPVPGWSCRHPPLPTARARGSLPRTPLSTSSRISRKCRSRPTSVVRVSAIPPSRETWYDARSLQRRGSSQAGHRGVALVWHLAWRVSVNNRCSDPVQRSSSGGLTARPPRQLDIVRHAYSIGL